MRVGTTGAKAEAEAIRSERAAAVNFMVSLLWLAIGCVWQKVEDACYSARLAFFSIPGLALS